LWLDAEEYDVVGKMLNGLIDSLERRQDDEHEHVQATKN